MQRRRFLAKTSAWAAAAAFPKLSHASVIPTLDPASEQCSMSGQIAFPKGFLWGSATASYQVEGAWKDVASPFGIATVIPRQRKRRLDWSRPLRQLFPENIVIMKQMNLRSYRYSIA
jgi:beta-glucosidase